MTVERGSEDPDSVAQIAHQIREAQARAASASVPDARPTGQTTRTAPKQSSRFSLPHISLPSLPSILQRSGQRPTRPGMGGQRQQQNGEVPGTIATALSFAEPVRDAVRRIRNDNDKFSVRVLADLPVAAIDTTLQAGALPAILMNSGFPDGLPVGAFYAALGAVNSHGGVVHSARGFANELRREFANPNVRRGLGLIWWGSVAQEMLGRTDVSAADSVRFLVDVGYPMLMHAANKLAEHGDTITHLTPFTQ